MRHPSSDIQSTHIGERTRIWQFCVILPQARIGSDCNICSHVFIENDVVVGDRVTVKCGVQLWDGVQLEDDVFIGPNVTFTNDRFPRSGRHPGSYPVTRVGKGASIGANATLLPGITIGRGAMIAAGAIVSRDVPPRAIVRGSPARISGYVQHHGGARIENSPTEPPAPRINGVSFVRFKAASDSRGDLLAVELENEVPFPVERLFFVMNVPSYHVRGEHAHHQCHQLLACLQGQVTVTADNGRERQEWVLERPDVGLYLHPLTWATQWNYSENAVLAVFASHPYDPDDYIRDYDEYLRVTNSL